MIGCFVLLMYRSAEVQHLHDKLIEFEVGFTILAFSQFAVKLSHFVLNKHYGYKFFYQTDY